MVEPIDKHDHRIRLTDLCWLSASDEIKCFMAQRAPVVGVGIVLFAEFYALCSINGDHAAGTGAVFL